LKSEAGFIQRSGFGEISRIGIFARAMHKSVFCNVIGHLLDYIGRLR
jgi:hypothetical protein